MFLRLFTPRSLFLALLGITLPVLCWQALDPLARYGLLREHRWEANRCGWSMRTLAGAIEMYNLDFNTTVEVVDPGMLDELVTQGYLQRVPEHRKTVPLYDSAWRTGGPTSPYLIAPQSRYGVVCRIHGEGEGHYRHRPLTSGLAYLGGVATPYAAGVLVTLLLQGLFAWRRRRTGGRGTAVTAAGEALPEWFSEPVFKPATKAVIADLGPEACCPVCSQHLVGGVESMVECLRCATPHHLDCAGYTAQCGVYACGGET